MKTIEVTDATDGDKIIIFIRSISAIVDRQHFGCTIYAGSAFRSRFQVEESYKKVILLIHKELQV